MAIYVINLSVGYNATLESAYKITDCQQPKFDLICRETIFSSKLSRFAPCTAVTL